MDNKFIIDYSTKNESFIHLHNILKSLGVKNNTFFLKLYDPYLHHVDPYDPNLSDEMKIRIFNECSLNPWYYLREVCRIPEMGGGGRPFILHRGNLATVWCFLNSIDTYLTLPTQNYKSQSIVAILNWAFNFGVLSSNFLMFGKTPEDAQMNLSRFLSQVKLLPDYLRIRYDASDYSRIINNKYMDNRLDIKGCPKSKEKADLMGRGLTHPIQYMDDVEFTQFIKILLQSSAPAFHTSKQISRRNGKISCRILTSVPGNLEMECCIDMLQIIDGAATWNDTMYDWSINQINDYIRENSINDFIHIQFDYKQIGRDDEWFKNACRMYNNDPKTINRELLLKRE